MKNFFVNIAKANAEILRLTAELSTEKETHKAALDAAIAERDQAKGDLTTSAERIKTLTDQVAALTTEKAELQKIVDDPKGAIAQAVAAELAAQGLDPEKLPPAGGADGTDHAAVYRKLVAEGKAQEAGEYFEKNIRNAKK